MDAFVTSANLTDDVVTAGSVSAVGVKHRFDNGHLAVDTVNLTIPEGEFWTLLGPSGSGKTTLLRIFAGLITPSEGRISIDGADVTHESVQKRNIGFVFQHYALFPHLTVADNVAFPLSVRRWNRADAKREVAAILDLVELGHLADRYPSQLSGGQQQRVAIARALVYRPKVLLLDEPMGALDQRLRQQLGSELRAIQKRTGTTAIYVTHDQNEAFLLSDTVVVMNQGQIQQIGRPAKVYSEPANSFVAQFLGETNLLPARVIQNSPDQIMIDVLNTTIPCSAAVPVVAGDRGLCSLRPEDIDLYPRGQAHTGMSDRHMLGSARVESLLFIGSRYRVHLRHGDQPLAAECDRRSYVPEIGTTCEIACRAGSAFFVPERGGAPS